ncbi:MAG: hypothetical protein AB7S38_27660 [Vulcanimicrobiota bacterium]
MMKHFIASVAAASCLLAAGPAMAHEDNTTMIRDDSKSIVNLDDRGLIMFHEPVAIEGTVRGVHMGQIQIEAENNQMIEVPHMALVWNGDTKIFAQDCEIGDHVIMHLRQGEPYDVMKMANGDLALLSYDGVFRVPESFIAAIDIDGLDGDIYANTDDRNYTLNDRYIDADNDGIRDDHDAWVDVDNDGINDSGDTFVDADKDGIRDDHDSFVDADNDGMRDKVTYTDVNKNGIRDDVEDYRSYDYDLRDQAVSVDQDDDELVTR